VRPLSTLPILDKACVLLMTILPLFLSACGGGPGSGPGPRPPMAAKQPVTTTVHGETRTDDFAWLREKSNPEVAGYLEAENAYAEAVLAPVRTLEEKLYEEMLGRIKQTDLSAPYPDGDYWYYTRTEEGLQYPTHCRRRGSMEGEEQVLLDLNEMAKGHSFMSLGAFEVSPDGRLLAYSTDNTGFRQYALQVMDLGSRQVLPVRRERVGSVAWASDNKTLFYTVEDEQTKRQYQLWRHALGEAEDALIYEESDERFNVEVERSRSGGWLILTSGSLTTTEVRVLRSSDPAGTWRLVDPRVQDREYYVDHQGDHFWIRTNDTGRNFRLVKALVADPSPARWEEVVAHRDDVMLSGMDFFANHYVLYVREGGLEQLRVTDLRTGATHDIRFPEPTYATHPSVNKVYDTKLFRYDYQSLVTPSSIYEYDMDSRDSRLLKRVEVLGGYEAELYVSERLLVPARDSVQVPVSLVLRKDTPLDGSAPMLLYGYGSYGYPSSAHFNSNRLSLIDRGFVVAIAHIRGGGDMGKAWHDDGRMFKKMNTFTDFIDVAEAMIARKYTSKERLVIEGGSAGGLLMGAVTNLRPDLFRAVVSHVAFVDVVNTMLDESLPLTVGEFEEWGNPKIPEQFDYIARYCPYSNLAAKDYPAILMTTAFNDSQVMYWEPAKYVAKLRTLKTDRNPLLLVTNMGAGHGGASGRYDRLKEIAKWYAFMLDQVGIRE
jgi:oligopeptidase B